MIASPLIPYPHHADLLAPASDRRDLPEPLQVTISEAARLLAYDARTIRRLIARGEISAVGTGRLRRIPMQSLRDYQQRNRTP